MSQFHQKIYQDLKQLFNSASNILLVSHVRPDGDSLGSLLALYHFFQQSDKKVTMFINDELPPDFIFLPHFQEIQTNLYQILPERYDVVVMLDCGELSRAGLQNFFATISYQPQTVNIDHHESNNHFANYNLVDLKASSTSEIIHNLFKYLNVKIDSVLATLLLTGIMTDTYGFFHSSTGEQTFSIAADLLLKNASFNLILDKIFMSPSVKSLKLWGKALARLKISSEHGLATTAIFQDDLEEIRATSDDLSGLDNFLNQLTDVPGTLVLKEHNFNTVKGSLRTNRNDVNVAQIASQFGGGGHAKAAGFKTPGRIVKNDQGEWQIEKEL